MGFVYAYVVAMIMLLGGDRGRTDLLDAVAPDVYWQLKGVTPELTQLEKDAGPDAPPANLEETVKRLQSDDFPTRDKARQELERMGPAILEQLKPLAKSPDPEVAAVATELVKRFSLHREERVIRRLMAIRTLGDRKEKDALPLLKGLENSNEMFVGDYARRAEAAINGEPYVPVDTSAAMERDIALLPADTALIAQSRGVSAEQLTVSSIVERAVAAKPQRDLFGGMPVAPAVPPDRKQMITAVTRKVLSLVERVGDVQIDGMSVGFTMNKDNDGWGAVILHGKYDAPLVFNALRESMGAEATAAPAEKPGDIPALNIEDGAITALFPDNNRLVLVAAPKERSAAIRDAFIASLKSGKGTLADNKEMAALLKTVDTKAPVWMAARLTETMQQDIFAGFQTVTLDSKATKEGVTFTFKGSGNDEKVVQTAVERMDTDIKAGIPAVQAEAARDPSAKPMVDFMTSIKVTSEGKQATLTGEFRAQMIDAVLGEFGVMSELISEPAPGAAEEIPPEAQK